MQNAFTAADPDGEAVLDAKGNPVWDSELKQIEIIPLGEDLDAYMQREVLPFVSDAVVDETVTDERDGQVGIVGYEVNFNKYFYKYIPPRPRSELEQEILSIEEETQKLLQELFK